MVTCSLVYAKHWFIMGWVTVVCMILPPFKSLQLKSFVWLKKKHHSTGSLPRLLCACVYVCVCVCVHQQGEGSGHVLSSHVGFGWRCELDNTEGNGEFIASVKQHFSFHQPRRFCSWIHLVLLHNALWFPATKNKESKTKTIRCWMKTEI